MTQMSARQVTDISASGQFRIASVNADRGDDLAYCFPAMDEAGQYERADAGRGTAWDMARALAPDAIFLPDCRRDAVLRGTSRLGTSAFPPGWDADMTIAAVLAVARDPDRITWDDAAGWPGTDITRQPAGGPRAPLAPSPWCSARTARSSAPGPLNGQAPQAASARRPRPPATTPRSAKGHGMTADETTSLVHGQAGHQPSVSRREPGDPGPLPAVISHLTAMCRARQARGVTADVQTAAPGRYVVTICRGRKELSLTIAWRRRRWDLADVQLTEDGKPLDAARSMYEVIRLLSDHEIGTDTPSRTHGARLPRNSALETKKNTVLRV